MAAMTRPEALGVRTGCGHALRCLCQSGFQSAYLLERKTVTYLDGAEGEWLRGELTSVIRDLLTWAAVAQQITIDDSADNHENGEAA